MAKPVTAFKRCIRSGDSLPPASPDPSSLAFGGLEIFNNNSAGRGTDWAWIPGWVAFNWYRRPRRAFARAPAHVKSNGASIILVGVSPTADVGIPGWARPTVAIMRAPDFFPRILKLQEVGAIGSGSGVDLYVHELEELQRNYHDYWQAETGAPGGYGRILLHFLQQTVEEHPSPGVSHHLHLCLVRRGEIRLMKSDHTVFPPNGPAVKVQMPEVATTWSEFNQMCSDISVEATQAKC
jgi:hypothetical protein